MRYNSWLICPIIYVYLPDYVFVVVLCIRELRILFKNNFTGPIPDSWRSMVNLKDL